MTTDFKLIGLSKSKSITCENNKNQEIFHPEVKMSEERFNALWNNFGGSLSMKMIAEIEHENFSKDGTPIKGVVVDVKNL